MTPARTSDGFTLLEAVVALTLLAALLAMLFGGLRAGIQSWEAGSDRGDRSNQALLTAGFLRKEVAAAFPWRFKDPLAVRLAFRGEPQRLQFVSMRPAEIGGGGLAFVSIAFEQGQGTAGGRLVMRRTYAAIDAADFSTLDAADAFTLFDGVSAARFSYFGSENDVIAPSWNDKWEHTQRIPTHVRLELSLGGAHFPDLIVALRLGEEAGCLETSFQRTCVPRR
jgi:general secretion pathway protein J